MWKRNILLQISITVCFLFILLVPILAQESNPSIPQSIGYLNDYDNQCSATQAELLESTLISLEKDTGVEIAILTMADCGLDPVSFRGQIFKEWGIGKKGKDNGLLILACIEQKTLEQETGYAMEVTLPDLLTRLVASDKFVPRAKNGQVCQGIVEVVQAYDLIIRGDEYVHVAPKPEISLMNFILLIILLIVILIIIGVYGGGSGGGGTSYSGTSNSSPSGNWGGGSSGGGGSSTGW